LVPVPVQLQPHHLPVADREDVGAVGRDPVDLYPAAATRSLIPHEDDEAAVIRLAEPFGNRPEVLPGIEHRSPALGHPLHPLPTPAVEAAVHHEFDPWIGPPDRAEVALLPGIEDGPDEVEVARHRPSISAQPAGRTASRIAAAVTVAAAAPI